MNRFFIALGSNIDKERNLPRAVSLLAGMCRLAAVSPVYETVPVGLLNQPNFLNAAAIIESELEPAQVKAQILGRVEAELKRRRQADKNAPRTIDADIVLWDGVVTDYDPGDGRLRHIPEPDLLRFAHVAVPVADLAPQMAHPETGEALAEIAARLRQGAKQGDGRPALWTRPDIILLAA